MHIPLQACSGAAWVGLCDATYARCAPRPGPLLLPAPAATTTIATLNPSTLAAPLFGEGVGPNYHVGVNGTGVYILRVRGVVRDTHGAEVALPRLVGGDDGYGLLNEGRSEAGAAAGVAAAASIGSYKSDLDRARYSGRAEREREAPASAALGSTVQEATDDGPPAVALLGLRGDGVVPSDALTLAWAPPRLVLPHALADNTPRCGRALSRPYLGPI